MLFGMMAASGPVLYNVEKDPTESANLAEKHPDVVARLRAEAQRREKELKTNRRPAGTVRDGNK